MLLSFSFHLFFSMSFVLLRHRINVNDLLMHMNLMPIRLCFEWIMAHTFTMWVQILVWKHWSWCQNVKFWILRYIMDNLTVVRTICPIHLSSNINYSITNEVQPMNGRSQCSVADKYTWYLNHCPLRIVLNGLMWMLLVMTMVLKQ